MYQWYKNLKECMTGYERPVVKPRDFLVLIASYGRPEGLQNMTMKTFKPFLDKVDYRIMVSDDDKTLPKYLEMYGDKVYVFNKDQVLKESNADTADVLNIKGVIFFERNVEFKVAKELGYRYFMHLEDDYLSMSYRLVRNNGAVPNCKMNLEKFDEICEMYFRVLDTSPFLNAVCMAQGGDYVGVADNTFMKQGYLFKGMNIYCFDTEKEFKLTGRINEDASAYYINGKIGKLMLTPFMIQLTQLPTQNNKGGVSDIYKRFGTYLKSIYTIIQRPDNMKIGIFTTNSGTGKDKYDTRRLHHQCDKKMCFTKIISSKYAKGTIPYSDVEQPDLDPDFYNQKNFLDLPEPNVDDVYIEARLTDEW
jgi:hypothetical protein